MATEWSRLDRGLLFGRMYEDPSVELAAFPAGGRIFCIASAGCTALALSSRGYDVTAVDLNRTQIEYVRARLAGAPTRAGIVDLAYAVGRRLLPLTGVMPDALRRFLELDDPAVQVRMWGEAIATPRFELMLNLALSRGALGLSPVRSFLHVLPPRFGRVIRKRIARGVAHHPNRTNQFMWRVLLGRMPPTFADPVPRAPITLVHDEALAFLERQPPRSFDGFTLSNIGDGADEIFMLRLRDAMRRCARPGARYVLRSFSAPRGAEEDDNAMLDRSHLWGRVVVEHAG
jgi:S-adenosylmethionine:diacylglycerol 3-amino-3-carboxypropyl transferase